MTDTINDNLELTVVNDGDGEQCGASYKERCMVFQKSEPFRKASAALTWVKTADLWMQRHGYQRVTTAELLDQASKVAAYYEEHVLELVA